MSYVSPPDFARKMVDAGESKAFMSTRDTLIRGFMAGAILALAAAFAITVTVRTGEPLAGAILFPIGFCLLTLLGYDMLTGVFMLTPLAWIDKRPEVTWGHVLRNWGLVFVGNFAGALMVAVMMTVVLTSGFTTDPNEVGQTITAVGEARTVGYAENGAAGLLTVITLGVLCNWMVCTGVVANMMSTSTTGKIVAMWLPILLFFYMGFEHAVVNMFLFPAGLMLGGDFTVVEYFAWNQLPVMAGNIIGGLVFAGLAVYATYVRTAPARPKPVVPTEPSPNGSGSSNGTGAHHRERVAD